MLARKGWLHCFEIIFVDHEKFFGDLAFALFLFLEGSAIPKRKNILHESVRICILHLARCFCQSWLILRHESFHAICFLARRPDILTVEDLKEFRYMEYVLKVN